MERHNLTAAAARLQLTWWQSESDALALLSDAMKYGTVTDWTVTTFAGSGGLKVTYHRKSGTFTFTEVFRPQFFVFRAKVPGALKIWAEYFQGTAGTDEYIHTVIPVTARTKKDAVALLESMHPSAIVDTLCTESDIREARVYAQVFPGRQIPDDFPWEEFEN